MNNKWILGLALITLASLLLSACGSKSWEEEETYVSTRIMADQVAAKWTLEPAQGGSSGGTRIRLAIAKTDGKPVEQFDINHEKQLHLILISKDLSYFNHIHPAYKGNGVFEIDNEFPSGGEYRVIADFKPTGGDSMTKMEWLKVEGKPAASQPAPVVPDEVLERTVAGKKVRLAIEGLEAKKEAVLTFSFADEKSGTPITDLDPYLGAIGHVVVLSEDGQRYVHVHAEEDQGTGPAARFEAQFPSSGTYKIWGQFQKDDQVFTIPFVVKVP